MFQVLSDDVPCAELVGFGRMGSSAMALPVDVIDVRLWTVNDFWFVIWLVEGTFLWPRYEFRGWRCHL